MTQKTPQDDVVKVTGDYAETSAHYWHREGTNDYKNEGFEIEAVEDREGQEHEPRWGEDPIELFPGVSTRKDRDGRHLRIARSACPVRVRKRQWYEYVSYDWYEHNYSTSRVYWIRFESGEEPGAKG